jgi:hypothetical protein
MGQRGTETDARSTLSESYKSCKRLDARRQRSTDVCKRSVDIVG